MTDKALEEYFPFLKDKKQVIAIVGAGGKTTLLYTLAEYYAGQGASVTVTTTTHIKRPGHYPVAGNKEELLRLLAEHRIVVAGKGAPEGKLVQADGMGIADYQNAADIVLVEADGAKHFPCKVPVENEPVIPKESRIVLGVAGLDAVGKPLQEVCFRKERAMELLGKTAKELMTEQDLAKILLSGWGTRKNVGNKAYYVVLNKCDNELRKYHGEQIRNLLMKAGIADAVCISLAAFWQKLAYRSEGGKNDG